MGKNNSNGQMNRSAAEKEIKDMFGFNPDFLSHLPDSSFGVMWGVMRELVLGQETVLEPKTKELIGLAVSAHSKCRYCTYFHTRGAQTWGASQEEIREAIAVGGATAMFSNVLTGSQMDLDKFKKEIERGLEHMTSQMK